MLADPGPALGQRFALHLPQGPAEGVAGLGQARVADHEVGRQAAELLDHVGAGGPQVAHVRHVGLEREGGDALPLQRFDEVEAVDVGAMEVHAHRRGAVQPGRQGERLAEPAVLARAGDEHAPAGDAAAVLGAEAEAVGVDGEGHA